MAKQIFVKLNTMVPHWNRAVTHRWFPESDDISQKVLRSFKFVTIGQTVCENFIKTTQTMILYCLIFASPRTNPLICSWRRHQMETFSALLAICAGNSPVSGEFPAQRPVTRSFDVFFDQRLNKGLSKQSWGWQFETHSSPLWRHSNVIGPWEIRL